MIAKVTLSALALALAAPAFAATQLERAAGVDAGVYTEAALGEIASAEKPNVSFGSRFQLKRLAET